MAKEVVVTHEGYKKLEEELDTLKTVKRSEIAEKIGYYNLSSFTRRFKQSLGISPSEYRALHREN